MNTVRFLLVSFCVAFAACGGSPLEDLAARFRAEGALVPIDETGTTLRFASREKMLAFKNALTEMGFSQQRDVATQVSELDSPENIQGITATVRFDGCRGELTRDTVTGFPTWRIYTSRTVMENVYPRGDGWEAEVLAYVALPSSRSYDGSWVSVPSLYNGMGYDPLVKDSAEALLVMDGSERRSKHQCWWRSKDSVCSLRILGVCVDHAREWGYAASREVEVAIRP